MNLGKAIKNIREKKGLSQSKAAQKIGISQQRLSSAEKRKDIESELLKKICKGYDVPPVILAWMAVETTDVQPNKKAIYKKLAPLMQNLIDEYAL